MVSGLPASPLSFPASGYVAVALPTESELRAEWSAMRNCTLEYIAACVKGQHCALSLRDRESGERAATVILAREAGRFVVREARRRFNRPAGPVLWAAAERAAVVYSAIVLGRRGRRASVCGHARMRDAGEASGSSAEAQTVLDFELA